MNSLGGFKTRIGVILCVVASAGFFLDMVNTALGLLSLGIAFIGWGLYYRTIHISREQEVKRQESAENIIEYVANELSKRG